MNPAGSISHWPWVKAEDETPVEVETDTPVEAETETPVAVETQADLWREPVAGSLPSLLYWLNLHVLYHLGDPLKI